MQSDLHCTCKRDRQVAQVVTTWRFQGNKLPVNLCKPDVAAVVLAVVINPTSAMAKDNLEDKPKPSTLDVKPEPIKVKPTNVPSDNEPLKKKPRINSSSGASDAEEIWLKLGKNILTWGDRDTLCNGMQLNDRHINYCQCLLKRQFPSIGGLILGFFLLQ